MTAKKKYKKTEALQEEVREPETAYHAKKRIRFSSIENQGDILLEHSMSLTPAERINLMYELNAMVFKIDENEPYVRSKRITFSSYEYSAG
jgi:hypothetical protein